MALCWSAVTLRSFLNSVMPEIAEHRVNPVPDYQVHHPEIRSEQENRDNHHCRRGPHFLKRGRGHLLHLGAHIVVERLDPLRPGLEAIAETTTRRCDQVSHLLRLDSHSRPGLVFPQTLAGAEGFEPPSSVLETDSLTVELTPLKQMQTLCRRQNDESYDREPYQGAEAAKLQYLIPKNA